MAYIQHGEQYLVIASQGGAPTNPAWYHNILVHPEVTIEVGAEQFQARATVPQGEARDRLFHQMAAQLPNFAEYQRNTTRRIPVVVLERTG